MAILADRDLHRENKMTFDPVDFAAKLKAIGTEISPANLDQSSDLYTPLHEQEPYKDIAVQRDVSYGSDERHRLDVFTPQKGSSEKGGKRPVLIFVHGGGFVAGDKKRPGTPYQDNVAVWAVRNGMIGVNITYRLAPDHQWPSGAEDVGASIEWVRENIASQGGDPKQIYVMGTSAGAVHVASYVAHDNFHQSNGPGISGAVFLSGIYNLKTAESNDFQRAYFGDNLSLYGQRSSATGLLQTAVPLLFVVTEFDPRDFQAQALELINSWWNIHGRWPNLVRLNGHNHFTSAMHLNTADKLLSRQLLQFFNISKT